MKNEITNAHLPYDGKAISKVVRVVCIVTLGT